MEDNEVLDGFARGGARRAFGPMLHIEGDCLFFDGWWQLSLRIAEDTFIVRNEEPPKESTLMADLGAVLTGKGLQQVGVDLPGVTMITYTEFTLGGASWIVWAPDLATADANLNARVTRETFFDPTDTAESADADAGPFGEDAHMVGASAELGGARRVAGLPPAVVLGVGMADDTAKELDAVLGDCHVRTVSLAAGLDACSSVIPTLIVVNAMDQPGREFIMELRAAACGRFIPVVALTEGGDLPLGAEAALDYRSDPSAWVAPIRALLP